MEQIILHLIGDYLLQNDYLAQNKTKNSIVAFIHALLYSLPFILITNGFTIAWWVIFTTHFFIDRFRLATYYIKLVNWNWNSKNFGFDNDKPIWLSLWLMIIIDNVIHITINYLSIKYL